MKRFLTFLMTVLLLVCTTGSVYAEEYVNMDNATLYATYQATLQEILKRSVDTAAIEQTADSPITFRSIPWGCSPAVFTEKLNIDGVRPNFKSGEIPSFERDFVWTGNVSPLKTLDDGGCYVKNLRVEGLNVAGYPVPYIGAYFMHGFDEEAVYESEDKAEFYLAYYEFAPVDYAGAYEMLSGKLNQLYGQGTEHVKTSSWSFSSGSHTTYTNWIEWSGAENTGTILYFNYDKYDDGNIKNEEMYLYYGLNDSTSRLNELEAAMAREQLQQAATDMSGL